VIVDSLGAGTLNVYKIASNAGIGSAPAAPTNLTASVAGSSVTLRWSAPQDGTVDTYVIEAGSASGLADLATVNTGTATTIFSAAGVHAGTYFVRVGAGNAAGTSGPSNETVVVLR
jgi:hypothetical protein